MVLYINTYLDKLGELVRGEVGVERAYELTDVEKIVEMFKRDCDEILKLYREGKASYEEIKRNFHLLKMYVITQLSLHFEKVKEIARSKGVEIDKKLDKSVVNEIAMYIHEIDEKV